MIVPQYNRAVHTSIFRCTPSQSIDEIHTSLDTCLLKLHNLSLTYILCHHTNFDRKVAEFMPTKHASADSSITHGSCW